MIKRLFLITCCLFLANAPAKATVLDIQELTSATGIPIWLLENNTIPVISLRFAFKDIGSSHDPKDKQGLSRIASNTMDEGAGPYTSEKFQKILKDEAITLRFHSSRDDFGGELKTLSSRKELAFTLLKAAIINPRFDKEPVGRMIAANKSRIKSSLNRPEWLSARIMNDKAFAGHPYALNSGGTLTTLDNITLDDLRMFAKTRFTRDRLVVSIAGDITAQDAIAMVDDVFGDLEAESSLPIIKNTILQNVGRIFLYKKDIPQTRIQIAQPGLDEQDPDYPVAQVMNFILGSSGFGSRLTEEAREKHGLTYGIYSDLQNMARIKLLSVATNTNNKTAAEMLEIIRAEWVRMKNSEVSDAELETAKQYLIGSLPLSLTSTNSITKLMLGLQLQNRSVDYLDQRERDIRAVTKNDIARIARRILDEKKWITILVGSPKGIDNTIIMEIIPNAE